MGVETLEIGNKLQLSDGSTVEVTGPASSDGQVPVRVLDAPFGPDAPGADKKVDSDDIYGVYADDSLTVVRAL
jgi:hypothetical protein